MLMALNPGTDAPISMSIPHLSLQDARHLQLAAQGLLTPRRAKAKPADLLATIRRMALLQIDTISVVARGAVQPTGAVRSSLARTTVGRGGHLRVLGP